MASVLRRSKSVLFGVLDGLGLPQKVDLDLAGVLQLVLDLLGNVPGQIKVHLLRETKAIEYAK